MLVVALWPVLLQFAFLDQRTSKTVAHCWGRSEDILLHMGEISPLSVERGIVEVADQKQSAALRGTWCCVAVDSVAAQV